jgi:cation transport regulator ChaC
MIKYFAYGSNMDISRLSKRGVNPITIHKGTLKNWKLVFNKKASAGDWGFANIIQSEGDLVEGLIFSIEEKSLKLLDKFEGAPKHYRRELIEIETDGCAIKCITYIAQPEHVVEGLLPTKEYMEFLLNGAKILSEEYQQKLFNILPVGS